MAGLTPLTSPDPSERNGPTGAPAHPRERWFRVDDLQAGLGQRTARGGAMTLGATAVNFVVTTVSTVLVTRNLTDEDFGLYGMVIVLTGFASMFVDLGLSRAVIQKPQINHAQVSTLFWINLAIAAALAFIVAAATPLIVWFYDEPRLVTINLAMAGLFVLSALALQHRALLTRRMEHGRLNLIALAAAPTAATTAVVVAFLGGGYWALVAIPATSQVVTVVGTWIACPWVPGPPRRGSGVRTMLAFGGHVTGFQFINYFARNADNAMLGYAWGPGPLGLYTRAYSLMMLPAQKVNAPLTRVIIPTLSRLTDQPERYRRAYLQVTLLTASILTPPCVWIFLTADVAIPLILGQQWSHMIPAFLALAPACLMSITNTANGWLYLSWGHVDRQLRWTAVYVPLILVGMAIGLQWGPIGVAIGVSSVHALLKPFSFTYASWGLPVRTREFLAKIYLPIAVCSIAGFVAFGLVQAVGLSQSAWWTLIGRTVVYVGLLGGTVLGLDRGRRYLRELMEIARILKPNSSSPQA